MVSSYTQLLARRYEGKLDDRLRTSSSATLWTAPTNADLINDLLAYSRVGTRARPCADRPEPSSTRRAPT